MLERPSFPMLKKKYIAITGYTMTSLTSQLRRETYGFRCVTCNGLDNVMIPLGSQDVSGCPLGYESNHRASASQTSWVKRSCARQQYFSPGHEPLLTPCWLPATVYDQLTKGWLTNRGAPNHDSWTIQRFASSYQQEKKQANGSPQSQAESRKNEKLHHNWL